ncbi:MAG: HAMP domain-containing histidine kinase [Firmicutes bacterium]|nr:HAMP domain-containing histidine kinase [Bacillota bacterium]
MKYSIQTKLFMTVSLIITFFIVILVCSHLLFYGKYTIRQYEVMLTDAYNTVSKEVIANNGYLSNNIEAFESASGMQIIFLNSDYDTVSAFIIEDDGNIRQKIADTLDSNLYEQEIKTFHRTIEEDGYIIYTQNDVNTEGRFLTLIGKLPLGNDMFYMALRISMPSIENNIEYSRFFIILTGCITLVFSLIIAYFISRHWVRPILDINDITKSMAQLDFSKKFKGKTTDEIGELGENINFLSNQLEDSIHALQRTNELLEEEVKKERQIDEMRQNLLANVSHDLKTPIAIIQGYAEGLRANISESPEDREFYTSVIIEESERMNKLVRQILSLSQLEMGKIKPEIESIEIASYVDVIMSKFSLMFKEKNINIESKVSPAMIYADTNMLGQVLVNLITNAADHTKNGGNIKISAETIDKKLRIKVFNEGENIPEDELDKIWLSFYKRDKARTGRYGGTGIGLTIVKTTMEAHNNTCGVQNEENGVTFWVEFDIDENPDDWDDFEA